MDAEPERLPADDEAPRTTPGAVPILVTDLANRVLAVKEGETFLYSDTEGNLDDRKDYGLGLYHRDTRFLSHFMMRLSGREPVLLSSSSERAYMAYVDLTNPDLYEGDGPPVTRGGRGRRPGELPTPARRLPDPPGRDDRRADRGGGAGPAEGVRRRHPRAPSVLRGMGPGEHAGRHGQRAVQHAPAAGASRPPRPLHEVGRGDRARRRDPVVRGDLRP